ncbi:helix-turn-helix domain-containing protein [Dehalococcoidia bacterium]|nr:helix-turn-helix domain-containing protein [Dehalococcoidia bacterium]
MTKLVTPIEAAAALKVDRMTIYRWIKRGRLPVRRLPSGLIRIKAEDVENLLTQCGS